MEEEEEEKERKKEEACCLLLQRDDKGPSSIKPNIGTDSKAALVGRAEEGQRFPNA